METRDAREMLREFFTILNTEEESDSGTIFHPTLISSCRTLTVERLKVILKELHEWSES